MANQHIFERSQRNYFVLQYNKVLLSVPEVAANVLSVANV